jgi:hypothetical protein
MKPTSNIALIDHYLANPQRRREIKPEGSILLAPPDFWIQVTLAKGQIQSLSYSSAWDLISGALWEGVADLVCGHSIERWQQLGFKELSHYLKLSPRQPLVKDKSDQSLFESFWPLKEQAYLKLHSAFQGEPFPLEPALFWQNLSLSERILWVKRFFSSRELARFRQQEGKIEVLDIQNTDIFIQIEWNQSEKSAFLDWLQIKMAHVFHEPRLNLIPE